MVKDRLSEFRENVVKHDDDEDSSIVNHFAVIDMEEPAMISVFDRIHFLHNAIDQLTELVHTIEHLQNAMLVPLPHLQTINQLEEKVLEIRQLSNIISKHLTEMTKNTGEQNACQRIIETHRNVLTERFRNVMNKYDGLVITYQERWKARIDRQIQLVGMEISEDQIDKLGEDGRPFLYSQINTELQQEKQALNEMEQRRLDIMKLEDTIRELHGMFSELDDLAKQVIYIPSIEKHVTNADICIRNGLCHLRKANKANESAKKKKTGLIATVIVLAIVFAVCLLITTKII